MKKLLHYITGSNLKWLLFSVILVLAAARRFSLPQFPFADHDLKGYLNPALVYFKTGCFTHFNSRSFPYPLFVLLTVIITYSLKGVTIAQHLLGLLSGILIFKIWDEDIFKSYSSRTTRIVATILQFTTTGYFMLSTPIILLEHTLRPESTSIFLMVLVAFLLVKSISRPTESILILATSLFLILFTFIYSPRWGLALPVTLAYILFAVIKAPVPASKKLLAVIIPVILFFLLAALPERYLIHKYDPLTNQFGLRQFFYDRGDIAKSLISEDSKDEESAKPFGCQTLRYIDAAMIIEPAHDFYFGPMGFNPDSLLYGRAGRVIDSVFRNNDDLETSFFSRYDREIVTRGLGKYTDRVFKELSLYYWSNPNHERVYVFEPQNVSRIYTLTKAAMYPDMNNAYPFRVYKNEVLSMSGYNLYSDFRFLNVLYFALQFSFLPTLVLFVITWFAWSVFGSAVNPIKSKSLNNLGKTCWLIGAIHFALVLTIAAIHTFGITRYVETIFPIAMLLQTFCLLYVSAVVLNFARK